MAIRIVLADDHPIILEGLAHLFRRERDFEVVATCTNGAQAAEAIRELLPDIAVLDVNMPNGTGLAVLKSVRADVPKTRVVLLTATLDDASAAEAVEAGVHGVVLKESAAVMLLDCVRRVAAGGRMIDPAVAERALRRIMERGDARALANTLSPRESEVVRMVAAGLRNKEIADQLAVAEGTVKTHLHAIYRKLGVKGRLELAIYAIDQGLN